MDLNITKISHKIHTHFVNKYPKLFPSLNITENDISKILTSKKQFINDKNGINNVISIIDKKIKEKSYSNKPSGGYANIQTNNIQFYSNNNNFDIQIISNYYIVENIS